MATLSKGSPCLTPPRRERTHRLRFEDLGSGLVPIPPPAPRRSSPPHMPGCAGTGVLNRPRSVGPSPGRRPRFWRSCRMGSVTAGQRSPHGCLPCEPFLLNGRMLPKGPSWSPTWRGTSVFPVRSPRPEGRYLWAPGHGELPVTAYSGDGSVHAPRPAQSGSSPLLDSCPSVGWSTGFWLQRSSSGSSPASQASRQPRNGVNVVLTGVC
jgi:hypothetical protein